MPRTFYRTAANSTFHRTAVNRTTPALFLPTCGTCVSASASVSPSTSLLVGPKVTIDDFKAVGKDQTATIKVTVTNNPTNLVITLNLLPNSGSGTAHFTSTSNATRTITQTGNVEIKGITESSTNNNMRLKASINSFSYGGGEDFTVVAVSLSFRTSGQVSTDNSAKDAYIALGTSNLGGPFLSSGTNVQWRIGTEIKATVLPTNFSSNLKLKRDIVSLLHHTMVNPTSDWTTDTICNNEPQPPCTDTSQPPFRDDLPSIYYDLDAPGAFFGSAAEIGRILRRRLNYREWATVVQNEAGEMKEVRVSDDLNWFFRISIQKTTSGAIEVLSDIPGDNVIGEGTTNLSANLQ